jgi:peptidylprolyl isomerase
MKKIILITFLIAFSALNNYAQYYPKEIREILTLQDTRTLGENNKLLEFLSSEDKNIVERTLIALANIADTNSIDKIGGVLLTSKETSVRILASFALGQINSTRSAEYLLKLIDTETDARVLLNAFESIGRIGDENALIKIIDYKTDNELVKIGQVLSIIRFGMRKIKNPEAIAKLHEIYASTENPETKQWISYAFFRTGDKDLLPAVKQDILELTKEIDGFTRMWAFGSLGKLQDDELFKYIFDWWFIEPDWHTKVTMTQSMANFKLSTQPFFDTSYLKILVYPPIDRKNTHVSITTLTAIAKLFEGYDKNSEVFKKLKKYLLEPLTDESLEWQIRGEAAKTLSKLYKDEVKDELIKSYKSTNNYDLKAEIVRSFSSFEDWKIYKEARDLISADVQKYNKEHSIKSGDMITGKELAKLYRAFVELLYNIKANVDKDDNNTLRLIFTEFLGSRDPYITAFCVDALQDSIYLKYRDETSQILMFDYNELQYPTDLDVMLMYIQAMGELNVKQTESILENNLKSDNYDFANESALALKKITGKDYSNQITAAKYRTDFEWDMLEELHDINFATIKTNRGDIKILLYQTMTPFTIMNFFKLARKKYFDGTIFHRMVPNFVIQGGDPTGTGYSGPGYSIRTEIWPMSFEEYTVGMASNGKDTEGSQFFITHSPQPHLDGKYTIFGKVTDGMDVVDKIQIGDYIETITFSNE